MLALVISDTHGSTVNLERLLERFTKLDMVFHLGDVEGDEDYIQTLIYQKFHCATLFVRGNMDFMSREPSSQVVNWAGQTIFMTHGHNYGVGYEYDRLIQAAKEAGANIAMFGHTHMPYLSREEGIMLLNPGSLSKPRQEGREPAYAILETDEKGSAYAVLCTLSYF